MGCLGAFLLCIVAPLLTILNVVRLCARPPTVSAPQRGAAWTIHIQVGNKVGWAHVADAQIRAEVWSPSREIGESDVVRWLLAKNVPARQIVGIERWPTNG